MSKQWSSKKNVKSVHAERRLFEELANHPWSSVTELQGRGHGPTWLQQVLAELQRKRYVECKRFPSDKPGRPRERYRLTSQGYRYWREQSRKAPRESLEFLPDLFTEPQIGEPSQIAVEGLASTSDNLSEIHNLLKFVDDFVVNTTLNHGFSGSEMKITIVLKRTGELDEKLARAAKDIAEINEQVKETYKQWQEEDDLFFEQIEQIRQDTNSNVIDYINDLCSTLSMETILAYATIHDSWLSAFPRFVVEFVKEFLSRNRESLRRLCDPDIMVRLKNIRDPEMVAIAKELKFCRPVIESFEKQFVEDTETKNWIQRHLNGNDPDWMSYVPFEYFGFERTFSFPLLSQREKCLLVLTPLEVPSCLEALEDALHFRLPLWEVAQDAGESSDAGWLYAWKTARHDWRHEFEDQKTGELVQEKTSTMIRRLKSWAKKGWRGPRPYTRDEKDRELVELWQFHLSTVLFEYIDTYYRRLTKFTKADITDDTTLNLFYKLPVKFQLTELFDEIRHTLTSHNQNYQKKIEATISHVRHLTEMLEAGSEGGILDSQGLKYAKYVQTPIPCLGTEVPDESRGRPPTDEELDAMLPILEGALTQYESRAS